jgi:hypothetical protein
VHRESLKDGTDTHDEGTGENAPSATPAVVAVGSNGDSDNGTELVAGRDEAEHTSLDGGLSGNGVLVTFSEV